MIYVHCICCKFYSQLYHFIILVWNLQYSTLYIIFLRRIWNTIHWWFDRSWWSGNSEDWKHLVWCLTYHYDTCQWQSVSIVPGILTEFNLVWQGAFRLLSLCNWQGITHFYSHFTNSECYLALRYEFFLISKFKCERSRCRDGHSEMFCLQDFCCILHQISTSLTWMLSYFKDLLSFLSAHLSCKVKMSIIYMTCCLSICQVSIFNDLLSVCPSIYL